MKNGFVLFDDVQARATEPYALTRPFGELRAGALAIRERWERVLGLRATAFIGAPHLAAYDELGAPPAAAGILKAGTIVANTRFAAMPGPVLDKGLSPGHAIESNERVVAAVALGADTPVAALADGATELATFRKHTGAIVPGWWMHETWDLIRHLPEMLALDATALASPRHATVPKGVTVIGEHAVSIAPGAYVEPHVVFDTTAGAVVVQEGARIGAFARIAGPAVIGAHTQVAGGRYSCISIGEHSRICGEMSVVIGSGYSNKGHDGFVGHSVLGRWSNLGAGTTTSNLKNSYGPVRITDSRGDHETGMQFLGSLIGDHAKTAILTRLNTGTVVGAGANLFGDRGPDAYVAPFAWGNDTPAARFQREKFVEIAAHVMHRRAIEMSTGTRASLAAAWDRANAPPRPRPPRNLKRGRRR